MVKIQVNSQGKAYLTSNNKVLLTSGDTSTRYGLSINDFIGEVDNNGVMEPSEDISGITFDDVVTINSNNENKPAIFMRNMNVSGTISFPNLTTIGNYGLYYSFTENKITSVSMPNLTIVGNYGMDNCFKPQTKGEITTIDLTNLTTIGSNGLRYAFPNNKITSLDLSSLTNVGNYGLYNTFQGNPITTVDVSGITNIDTYGLYNAFYNCQLTSVDFDNLSFIGAYGLYFTFYGNKDENRQSTLQTLYFPALTSNSFTSGDTTAFDNMLSSNTGVTVHFPFDLESVIGSWSSVTNGFGGTNTTVLFDLNRCVITFDITPNNDNQITVNSEILTGNTVTVSKNSTMNYGIYNTNYGVYINTYSVLNTDIDTINIDLTQLTYNTITFNVGVTGLSVSCQINGCLCNCIETSAGVYTLEICNGTENNVTVEYYVDGGDFYSDYSGTTTFADSDVSLTITLTPATTVQFVRPNLSDNGTMGGNDFAVQSSDNSGTAYYAVDGGSGTYLNMINQSSGNWFDFYNPIALKVSELGCNFTSTTRAPKGIVVEGSNDESTWEELYTWSGTAATLITCTIPTPKSYKYYRLNFSGASGYRFSELTITATYKQ